MGEYAPLCVAFTSFYFNNLVFRKKLNNPSGYIRFYCDNKHLLDIFLFKFELLSEITRNYEITF